LLIALTIVLVLCSLGLIVTILFQSGRSAGLSGAISGIGESVFGKKKGMDELFAKITAVLAAIFLLSSLGITMLLY
jgi:preprotein translocase subunit SecG